VPLPATDLAPTAADSLEVPDEAPEPDVGDASLPPLRELHLVDRPDEGPAVFDLALFLSSAAGGALLARWTLPWLLPVLAGQAP
jgi:hypothetical protein